VCSYAFANDRRLRRAEPEAASPSAPVMECAVELSSVMCPGDDRVSNGAGEEGVGAGPVEGAHVTLRAGERVRAIAGFASAARRPGRTRPRQTAAMHLAASQTFRIVPNSTTAGFSTPEAVAAEAMRRAAFSLRCV
jgi:hypothetical protein